MKKLSKIFLIILALFMFFMSSNKVNAEVYKGKLYDVYHPDSGFTIFAEESNRWMDYNSWTIKSSIDSEIYYCIDPALALGEAPSGSFEYVVGDKNIIGKANLTKEKLEKIKMISYYGYSYKRGSIDHTSKKWYGITQVMIWRVMRPDLTWTFKENRNAKPDKNLYIEEVNEINKLIQEHEKIPSFSGTALKLLIGDSITLTDKNNVFEKFFRVNALKYVDVKENGNKLTITATKQGKETISYSFRNGIVNPFALFTSSKYQDIISRGKLDSFPHFDFKVEVTGGTLNLQKIDSSTLLEKAQGDATLKGAVYEIYDSSNKSAGKITTDDKGQGKIILDYGKYKIKEVKAPEGYKLSDEVYEFEINKDNTDITVKAKDQVITGKIVLTKKKGGAGENFSLEEGASFEFINSKGEVVQKIATNENGIITVNLPYGKYTIHQTTGESGYVLADDIKVNITENKTYEININNIKLSKLEFIKTDKKTGKRLSNTTVEIYKENDELIYTGTTDKNGMLEVPNLDIGKYYILEKNAHKYYKLNNEKIYFEVTEHGKVIKVNMENERNKGSLEFLKLDSITKKGLANVLIKIVSSETNKEVFKGKTDKDGKVFINNIDAGKYCIYEEKALKGYLKNNEPVCFEIKYDNELVKVSMTNEKLIEVPNTYKNEINALVVTGILLIVVGITFTIYEKRKKQD